MNYEIIQINENSWRIEDGGVRFFLLAGSKKALLIDSGMEVNNAKEIAESLTDLPLSLLNTHADRDHTGSNAEFESFYMHPDEEPNYVKDGIGGTIIPVKEGDVLDLGGRPLEIIHIPGHTPGSIALLDRNARVLISGDSVQNGHVFMFGPFRNIENYIKSMEHLKAWDGTYDEVWPSHGDIPVSPDMVGKLAEGAKEVLAGKVASHKEAFHGMSITIYDLGYASFLYEP